MYQLIHELNNLNKLLSLNWLRVNSIHAVFHRFIYRGSVIPWSIPSSFAPLVKNQDYLLF